MNASRRPVVSVRALAALLAVRTSGFRARKNAVVSMCALAALLVPLRVGWLPDALSFEARLRAALWDISDVRIVGSLRWVSREELKRAIAGRLKGGFFRVDIAAVRESALAVSGVRDVSVRRVWPGELRVTVVEDRPVARWANGGLVTERGAVLPAQRGQVGTGLPVFAGPREAIPRLVDGLREFSPIFDGIGGGIARLERSAAGDWSLLFVDGVRLVFRDEQEEQVRRFKAVYLSALIGRRKSIVRIDLRYPNGFAVRWRDGTDAHSRMEG